MELLVWNQDEDKPSLSVYSKVNKINNTYYKFKVWIYFTKKTIKAYIGASSGKKRRDLEIFEPNTFKPDGGIKALMWLKEQIEVDLPKLLEDQYRVEHYRIFLYIGWADAQRRDVYSRLTKSGFIWGTDDRCKILVKELHYEEQDV